jgi:hypothetical protein
MPGFVIARGNVGIAGRLLIAVVLHQSGCGFRHEVDRHGFSCG